MTSLLAREEDKKTLNDTSIDKVFNVKFKKINNPSKALCDFCEEKEYTYWCEFLVTGYCDDCMQEQMEEYKQ